MPYTGSKAQQGRGTTLSVGTGTPAVVGEIMKMGQKGRKNQTVSTTNLQSSSEEFQGTLPDQGSWEVEGNRVGNDAGLVAMETAFASGALTTFTVQLPVNALAGQTTTGDKWVFTAIVEELDYDGMAPKSVVTFKATLKVSGTPVFTAGT
jgi:hypothetical protein